MRCWNTDCGHPLELIDFYDDPDDRLGERIIRDALGQDGFVGFVARDRDRDLIGFSWGYRLPTVDTPTVEFSSTSALLAELGFDASTAFYAAEIGVAPEWQGVGMGTRLARARFRDAMAAGFSHVCFRTVDRPRVLGLYEGMFGAGRIRELFPDPDPAKSQIWFAADLAGLSVGPVS
jgi:ribosomal protein S18 acetylase RimI-like enzyme